MSQAAGVPAALERDSGGAEQRAAEPGAWVQKGRRPGPPAAGASGPAAPGGSTCRLRAACARLPVLGALRGLLRLSHQGGVVALRWGVGVKRVHVELDRWLASVSPVLV